jgi:hypothetical protein
MEVLDPLAELTVDSIASKLILEGLENDLGI